MVRTRFADVAFSQEIKSDWLAKGHPLGVTVTTVSRLALASSMCSSMPMQAEGEVRLSRRT